MATVSIATALRKAREARAAAAAEVERRDAQIAALEMALRDFQGDAPQPPVPDVPRPQKAPKMPRTEAILSVMAERPTGSFSPKELIPLVSNVRDHVESRRSISAALDYLRKTGKVKSPGHGLWQLASEPDVFGRDDDFEPDEEPDPRDFGYDPHDVDPDAIPF